MKKIISALVMSLMASAAFAQAGYPVSATAVATDDVSAPSVQADDVSSPYIAASVGTPNCCAVSVSANALAGRVSIPQKEDDSDSFAMAGLGFGLFGLVGVSKLARRKKQK
jgi:hypothetical protein